MSRIAITILIALMTVSGCARLMNSMHGSDSEAQTVLLKARKLSRAGMYADAAATYALVIEQHKNTAEASAALYENAKMLVSDDNPQRDYGQALANFEAFLVLNPKDERAKDARDWRQTVKTLLEFQRENERLSKQIERLKQLDMRQEEKRRGR